MARGVLHVSNHIRATKVVVEIPKETKPVVRRETRLRPQGMEKRAFRVSPVTSRLTPLKQKPRGPVEAAQIR